MGESVVHSGTPFGRVLAGRPLHKPAGSALMEERTFGLYAAVLVAGGGGVYADARGVTQTVEPGHLILVFPELPHRYGPDAQRDWQEYHLIFEGPGIDQWRGAGWLTPERPVWSVSPVDAWLERMQAVWEPGGSDAANLGRLLAWLGEAHEAQPALTHAGDREAWVTDARAILELNLERPVDLKRIARDLGMSYDLFRRRFAAATGEPPAKYRNRRAIDQAQMLMRTTAMSDKQIAHALGFCDAFYFSRRFKQLTGRSPRAFRQTLSEGP